MFIIKFWLLDFSYLMLVTKFVCLRIRSAMLMNFSQFFHLLDPYSIEKL